jgi:hypothetical protein
MFMFGFPVRHAAGIGAALLPVLLVAACAHRDPGPTDLATPGATVGQSVAVESWTARVRLAGRVTTVEVHQPRDTTAAAGAVILVHGFLRSRATMRGHARALAAAGLVAVSADQPYLVDSRSNALALRELVAMVRAGDLGGHAVANALPLVLVGFSAGGLAALLASDATGVVGYVGLDPYDGPTRAGREFARTLRTPALLMRGPPTACNAYGAAEGWAAALPLLVDDRLMPDATHCDFESPTDGLCRFVCGGTTPVTAQSVRDALVQGVLRLLAAASAAALPSP